MNLSIGGINNIILYNYNPPIFFLYYFTVIYFMSQFQEQKEMISELSYRSSKMTRTDYDEFQILVRRQKDDEDFNKESFLRLKELFEKYSVKKPKVSPKW